MKKYINIKTFMIGVIFMGIISSCDNDFADVNLDPDAVTSVNPGQLFSKVLINSSRVDMEPRTNYFHAFMQYGFSGFWSGTQYVISDNIVARYFNGMYRSPIKNVVFLIDQLQDDPLNVNTLSAARIWKVFLFQKMTDVYGDIPYFESGQSLTTRDFTPAYDTQEVIYNDLIKELQEAKAAFDSELDGVRGDQFYNGDIVRWEKLANSLLLRIGMRIMKVDPTRGQSLINEAVAGGVMESNDDMPVMRHTENEPNAFNFTLGDQHFVLHKTLVDHMKINEDPRLTIYGGIHDQARGVVISTDTTDYYGWSPNPDDSAATVRVTFNIYRPTETPFLHFSYAQVEFLLAEAAVRGLVGTDPQVHYENGIRASMQSLALLPASPGISDTQIADYIAANPFDDPGDTSDDSDEAKIEKIATEFWLSGFIFDADEVWNNWKRTGFPDLTPNPNSLTQASDSPGRIPRKLPYPQDEFVRNGENVRAVLPRYGNANDFNEASRVWWDID
ncbi:SusD/RagB family nutrient-binding outer membrane lipoprotein [Fulvivirgaceae bacterium BMA10]|uniref:SusD/RagB family nutrient-binding outer membrane lipoprotein n=1 Tax=Splendidivirga corallicola TaxID=3051826 RepID=A0ABT8KM87_9BACT|nr:SusD/RagB family nutrient-binding outer membrane lipoprotein [Fulvivirgaceae bacterium BMA10]